jgi:hypothetical protein
MPPYHSQYYSRSRWSDWSGFSLRLVGALVVFAIAALTGAVIGGVSVYLINDAVSPPPSVTANTTKAPALAENAPAQAPAGQTPGATNGKPVSKPVRMVDPAFPPPSSADANAAPPAPTETATQPPAETSVSSAATPAEPTAPQSPAAGQPQPAPTSTAASQAQQDDSQASAHDAAAHDIASPRKTTATRKRVTATSARQRTYYDYYDRDNRDNDDQQRASAATSDDTARARPGSRDGRTRRGVSQTQRGAFPAQPQPSFFGLFGDRHYDNDRN